MQIGKELIESEILNNPKHKKDVIKLMIQTLDSLGFDQTSSVLVEESGISLENEISSKFRRNVLLGQWNKALTLISNLKIPEMSIQAAVLLIYEEMYIEYIETKNIPEAINILRNQLAVLCKDSKKLNKLANILLCKSNEELYEKIGFYGTSLHSRKKLFSKIQSICEPFNLMEPNKIEKLLKQSLQYQIVSCNHHNKIEKNYSLLDDHKCEFEMMSFECCKTLTDSKEEVWILKFSNQGKNLAAILSNRTIIVWDFSIDPFEICLKFKRENAHLKEINNLHWSPEDKRIATSSSDHSIKIWSIQGILINTLKGHNEKVYAAIWHPTNGELYSGGIDNDILVWNQAFVQCGSIKAKRTSDLFISSNGKTLYGISASAYKIFIIDIKSKKIKNTQKKFIEEKNSISSACISKDGNFMLVNTFHKSPEIHLWSLEKLELLNRYEGHSQKQFTIKCCFGGLNDSMIACGGEDCKIQIWHRNFHKPQKSLEGHFLTVNCVQFHPINENIIVSGSDDYTIKVWMSCDQIDRRGLNNLVLEEKRKNYMEDFNKINEKEVINDERLDEDE